MEDDGTGLLNGDLNWIDQTKPVQEKEYLLVTEYVFLSEIEISSWIHGLVFALETDLGTDHVKKVMT